MHNAVRVVRTSRLSTNGAAICYKVPGRTLRAYLAENKRRKCILERKTVLLAQQEKDYPTELLG